MLKRFVDGAEGQPFYQKRAPDNRPEWLRTVTLSFPSGRTAEEVVVDDAAGLAWIVNLGCIELHPHAVRAGDLDHPDELRVDLDPGPGVAWDDVRRVALEVNALLERARAARLAEDQRLARHARQRAHRAALDVHRGAARGAGAVARDRAARADARDVEVVEGGAPRRLPRLQPERQGSHDLLGLFGPAAARRARVGAADAGTRSPDCEPADFTVLTMPARFAAIGDPHAGMDAAAGSLEQLLELAARDEASGLGDAPWPPHYQKMEGEAPRVAPSRAKEASRRQRRRPRAAREDAARDRRQLARARTTRSPASSAGRQRHPDAAAHLAVDDVLVDAMRGRSSTWTRIRVNLRNVPEAIRPPQETPDPDDDPTRAWREAVRKRPRNSGASAAAPRPALTPTLSRKREREKEIRSPRPAKRGEG